MHLPEWIYKPSKEDNLLNFWLALIRYTYKGYSDNKLLRDLGDYNHILFILLDGAGYTFIANVYKDLELPKPYMVDTLYPPTTASILTSLSTGYTPGRHGLLEWNLYIPDIDMLIETLMFRPYGFRHVDMLYDIGYKPRILFRGGGRIFRKLKSKNVLVKSFVRGYLIDTCYSRYTLSSSERIAYINVSDLSLRIARELVNDRSKRSFYYVYIEALDSIAHKYGYLTEESILDLKYTIKIFRDVFERIPEDVTRDTLLIIVADHGLNTVDPNSIIYLDKVVKGISRYIRRDSNNIPLVSGSPRNVYIHVRDGYVDKVLKLLDAHIRDKALILSKDEFLKLDILNEVSRDTYKRLGDVIILPKPNIGIWYIHLKGRIIKIKGLHGGLSYDEVKIPLIITYLNDFIKS